MTRKVIDTYTDDEYGMTYFLTGGDEGTFNVSLRDDESGEFVPTVKKFKDYEKAVIYFDSARL